MALDPQKYGFPFVQGEDTKTDPKQVPIGKLLSLSNGVLTSPKRIQKRPGNTALSQSIEGGGSISAGKALAPLGDELDLLDGTSLYGYNNGNSKWDLRGPCVSNEVTATSLFKDQFNFSFCDVAYHASSNLYFYLGFASYINAATPGSSTVIDNPYYSIINGSTGEAVVSFYNNLFASVGAVMDDARAYCVGNNFIVLYQSAVDGHLYYLAIPVATPLSPSAPVLISNDIIALATSARMDAAIIGTSLYIAWTNTTNGVNIATLTSGLSLSPVFTVAGANANVSLNVFGDSVLSQMWVVLTDSAAPAVKYFVRNAALGAVLAPTTIEGVSALRCTGLASNGVGVFYYSRNSAIDATKRYYFVVTASYNNAGVQVSAAATMLRSVDIVAKPWTYNSVNYLPTIYMGLRTTGSVNQGTVFVLNQSAVVVAKMGMSTSYEPSNGAISSTVSPNSGAYYFAVLQTSQTFLSFLNFRVPTPPASIGYTLGVASAKINFLSSTAYQTLQAANTMLITGGVLQGYDGCSITEYNFNVYPEVRSGDLAQSVGTGTLTIGGLYSYVVTYEWMDNAGQLHISNTSNIIQILLTAGNRTVTLTLPTLKLTQKGLVNASKNYFPNPVTVGIYRSLANSPGPFYRVYAGNNIVISDSTVNTVTYVDGQPDSQIVAFQQLYTTGGVVSNNPPPATSVLATFNQRVMALSSEIKTQFWYSQQVIPGSPVTFSSFFTWNVDTAGGDVTAYLQMDDKFILWKARSILYMVGTGPASNGTSNDFTTPQALPTDVGTNSQRSVCMTPIGAIFKSINGWYLLDRSLSVKYIGAEVESYNGVGVTKTVLVPGVTQIRAYLDNGSVLVYDYYLSQWYHFSSVSTVDAVVSQDIVKVVNSSGLVWTETPGTFTDNSAFVGMSIETSWIQFGDIQGYERLYYVLIFGEYKSPHTLRVQVSYDFDSTVVQTVNIPVTSPVTPYQFRVFFDKQKCEAIKLIISDVQNGSAGESCSISGLTFKFGVKKGTRRMPAASSFS